MREDKKYLSNRQKSQISRKCKFWCRHCDRDLVGEIGKCPTCGKREDKSKRKKK